jgi:hypothetical protein
MMSKELAVDPVVLREEVKTKYREVALIQEGNITSIRESRLQGGSVMIRRYSSRYLTRQSSHSPR